jgi:hypothetical protein
MRLFLLSLVPAAALAAFLPASGCNSSSGNGPDASTCTPVDASLTASLAAGGSGACNTCIQMQCATEVGTCSNDCTCNDPAVQALSCIEGLGSSATIAGETACIAPLANSSDTVLKGLGSCLLTQCQTACGGSPSEAGGCDAVSTSLVTLLEAGSGSPCQSCLQGSCGASIAGCANSCTCNAVAVTALDCLADLGDAASIASASSCVAPLTGSALGDAPLLSVGECLLSSCSVACGTSPAPGPDAASDGAPVAEASAPDSSTSAPDSGPPGFVCSTDAGTPNCVSVITSSKTVTADSLASIASTTVYYTMVGGGGGGAAMDYSGPASAGSSASPTCGSFTIGSNDVSIYVGGGGGGAGTWGGGGGAGYTGGGGGGDQNYGSASAGGGGSSAIVVGSNIIVANGAAGGAAGSCTGGGAGTNSGGGAASAGCSGAEGMAGSMNNGGNGSAGTQGGGGTGGTGGTASTGWGAGGGGYGGGGGGGTGASGGGSSGPGGSQGANGTNGAPTPAGAGGAAATSSPGGGSGGNAGLVILSYTAASCPL